MRPLAPALRQREAGRRQRAQIRLLGLQQRRGLRQRARRKALGERLIVILIIGRLALPEDARGIGERELLRCQQLRLRLLLGHDHGRRRGRALDRHAAKAARERHDGRGVRQIAERQQGAHRVGGALKARLRLLLEQAHHPALQPIRHPKARHQARRRLRDVGAPKLPRRLPVKGQRAADQLKGHHAQGVEVGPGAIVAPRAAKLLRRHILRCAPACVLGRL